MQRHRLLFCISLYAVILIYAALAFALGEALALLTVVALGLPMVAYLAAEWIVTPLVAGYAGFQSRFSHAQALLVGIPLALLYVVVTPTLDTGPEGLYVRVPWLGLYAAKVDQIGPVLGERLRWWACVYAAGYAVGMVSRWVCPRGDCRQMR